MNFVFPRRTQQHTALSWRWLLLLLCGSTCFLGCLNVSNLEKRYVRLAVEGLGGEVSFLRVEIAQCRNGKKVGVLQRRQRLVSIALGEEVFLLPSDLQGSVDVRVQGFSSASMRVLRREARAQIFLRQNQQSLPRFQLSARSLPAYDWCASPIVAPSTEDKKPSLASGSWNASGATSRELSRNNGLLLRPHLPREQRPSNSTRLRDRVTLQGLLSRKKNGNAIASPAWDVAIYQNIAVVTNSSELDDKSEDSFSVVDLQQSQILKTIALPGLCQPRGIAMNAKLCVVVCQGLNQVFFYDTQTWTTVGPGLVRQEGLSVGREPVAVEMSGGIAVVTNQGDNTVSVIRLDRFEITKTLPVGEKPAAVSAVHRHFFVANADSSSVSSFEVEPSGKVATETDFSVGLRGPVSIAANGWYVVVTNKQNKRVVIWDRLRQTQAPLSLLVGGTPHGVALLSHTAFVTDEERAALYVIDLRSAAVTQILALPQRARHLALAGEQVLMTSWDGGWLMRAHIAQRKGMESLPLSLKVKHSFVEGDVLWLHDPEAQRLQQFDLNRRRPIREIPLSNASWMIAHKGLLLHTGRTRQQLVVRALRGALPLLTPSKLFPSQPIRSGHAFDQRMYLLHWQDRQEGSLAPAQITQLELSDLLKAVQPKQGKTQLPGEILVPPMGTTAPFDWVTRRLDLSEPMRVVPKGTIPVWSAPSKTLPDVIKEPVDVLPFGETLIIAEQSSNRLFVLRAPKDWPASVRKPFIIQKTISLPARPLQIARVGTQIVVSLNDASIVFVRGVTTQEPHVEAPILLGGSLGRLRVRDGKVWVANRSQDLLLKIDPRTRQIQTRIATACDPKSFHIWKDKLVALHFCAERLSLHPLPALR